MAKSLGYFLKLQQVLYKLFFFVLVKPSISLVCLQPSTEKALFLASFKISLLITYLITLSLEKEIIVLAKQSAKSLEFWI